MRVLKYLSVLCVSLILVFFNNVDAFATMRNFSVGETIDWNTIGPISDNSKVNSFIPSNGTELFTAIKFTNENKYSLFKVTSNGSVDFAYGKAFNATVAIIDKSGLVLDFVPSSFHAAGFNSTSGYYKSKEFYVLFDLTDSEGYLRGLFRLAGGTVKNMSSSDFEKEFDTTPTPPLPEIPEVPIIPPIPEKPPSTGNGMLDIILGAIIEFIKDLLTNGLKIMKAAVALGVIFLSCKWLWKKLRQWLNSI